MLVNRHGQRFMADLHPDGELAPRDIVARAIFAETQAGNRPMLDTRAALGAEVLTRFPGVAETCARAGIDPATEAIPVAVAAHYHMGGIATDTHGRSSVFALWVCGEAASTGLHGANRLASNGLLEALVYAAQRGADIERVGAVPSHAAEPVALSFPEGGQAVDHEAVADLRRTMTADVGVRRNADGAQGRAARHCPARSGAWG